MLLTTVSTFLLFTGNFSYVINVVDFSSEFSPLNNKYLLYTSYATMNDENVYIELINNGKLEMSGLLITQTKTSTF